MGEFGVPSREEEAARETFNEHAASLREGLKAALDGDMFDDDGAIIGFRRSDGLSESDLSIVYYHLRCNGVAHEDVGEEHTPRSLEIQPDDDDPQPMTPQAEERFFGRRRGKQ